MTKSFEFICLRHAEAETNVDAVLSNQVPTRYVKLTAKGRGQAESVYEKVNGYFPDEKFLAVVSHYSRTEETAVLFKHKFPRGKVLGPVWDDIEEIHSGSEHLDNPDEINDLYGDQPDAYFWANYPKKSEFTDRSLDGESWLEMSARAKKLADKVRHVAKTGDFSVFNISAPGLEYLQNAGRLKLLIVSHNAFLNAFFDEMGLRNLDKIANRLSLINAEPIIVEIDDSGVARLTSNEGKFPVRQNVREA